jgi:O-antigen/teichoic acid export membrane protein
MNECTCRGKLGVFAFAMAIGIASALGVLLLGLAGHFFQSGLSIITLASSIYVGFEPTILGAVIGGLWAFLEGAIWGAIVAALYNKCLCCPICRKECPVCSKKPVQ